MRLRLAAMLLLALAPSAAASQDRTPRGNPHRNSYANPSALIAAEIALGQLTREEGQWAALRETAAPGAEMLVPERVNAQEWLKDRANPDAPPERHPEAVWISCDGSYGVVRGSWTGADASGHFATIWQRQEKGEYKWLFRHPVGDDDASTAPDMIRATIADCDRPRREAGERPPKREGRGRADPHEPDPVNAQADDSADGTLDWRFGVDEAGVPRLLVRIRKEGRMQIVLGGELERPAGS